MGKLSHNDYYSLTEILKKNCLFMYIESERGDGKTVSAIKLAVDEFINNRYTSIWARRYMTNIKQKGEGCAYGFFDGFNHAYPEYKDYNLTNIKNGNVTAKCYITIDGKQYEFMRLYPLSKQESIKGTFLESCRLIIYDEFQKEKSSTSYLPNEYNSLMNLYITIDRYREVVKCICLSNAVDIANPMYRAMKVPVFNTRFWYKKNKNGKNIAVVERFRANGNFKKMQQNSSVYSMLEGTQLGDYVFDNKYLESNDIFIEKKQGKCIYLFGIIVNNNKYGCWINKEKGIAYIDNSFNKQFPINYTLSSTDYGLNYYHMKIGKNQYDFGMLVTLAKYNSIRFENNSIKDDVLFILQKCY